MLHFKGISYSFLQYKYLLKEGTVEWAMPLATASLKIGSTWFFWCSFATDVCPHILLVEFEHQLVLGDLEPPP